MFTHKNGLVFKDICIDPEKKAKCSKAVFSHAHADHVALKKETSFFSTKETSDLIKARFGADGKTDGVSIEALPFNKEKVFENEGKNESDYSLTLMPNGHLLGSAQVKILSDGATYAATTDFRFQDSLLFKGAEPLRCDTLVLETTFGSPEYVFPKYEDTVSELTRWIQGGTKKGLVLLAGYALGKAQELTRISNDAGFVPVVHEKIFDLNKIYEKHGIKLGKYEKLNHNLKESQVLIMPPSLVNRHLFSTLEFFDKRKIFSGVATGWPYRGYFDRTFPLSNHADYNDLFAYVERANPKLILTDHGFCEEFARKLTKKGFNAKPLAHYNQRMLSEFE